VSHLRAPLGLIGFGALGRLMAAHLGPYFDLTIHDAALPLASLGQAAACAVVVLAVPVSALEQTVAAIAPLLRPGTLVLDVGSVKTLPAEIMRRGLPAHVDIVATHPLFGPQSAAAGIAGLKIAVCPIRGAAGPRVGAFLRHSLGLEVIMTTPEAHDREAATVQGLTHLIAKVLVQMEPLPTRMTTRRRCSRRSSAPTPMRPRCGGASSTLPRRWTPHGRGLPLQGTGPSKGPALRHDIRRL